MFLHLIRARILSDYPLTIELVPTRIVDQDGNVLRTIE